VYVQHIPCSSTFSRTGYNQCACFPTKLLEVLEEQKSQSTLLREILSHLLELIFHLVRLLRDSSVYLSHYVACSSYYYFILSVCDVDV